MNYYPPDIRFTSSFPVIRVIKRFTLTIIQEAEALKIRVDVTAINATASFRPRIFSCRGRRELTRVDKGGNGGGG